MDTGARLSYLTNDITKDYASIGTVVDFYPGVGQFETDCFEVPVVFDANSLVFKFGNLPEMLQRTLMLNGIRGIIGYDFFSRYQVLLDINNVRLIYV